MISPPSSAGGGVHLVHPVRLHRREPAAVRRRRLRRAASSRSFSFRLSLCLQDCYSLVLRSSGWFLLPVLRQSGPFRLL
jgi:hypothetical protein